MQAVRNAQARAGGSKCAGTCKRILVALLRRSNRYLLQGRPTSQECSLDKSDAFEVLGGLKRTPVHILGGLTEAALWTWPVHSSVLVSRGQFMFLGSIHLSTTLSTSTGIWSGFRFLAGLIFLQTRPANDLSRKTFRGRTKLPPTNPGR
jgi:hypothetical protein